MSARGWLVALVAAGVVALASRRSSASSATAANPAPASDTGGGVVRLLDYIKAGGRYYYAPEGETPREISRAQYDAAVQAANAAG